MSYKVIRYESLAGIIACCSDSKYFGSQESLADNIRIMYLDEYLNKLGTKTAIIEHEYVDRNFMDDYCGYYAKSFAEYPKKCERIHFFSCEFKKEELLSAILPDGDLTLRKKICDAYVGYIVMRPIMGAHLGRVCISTYPPEGNKNRIYPVLKEYHAHFMGLELTVKTVAFQEQDNVISACATSALWSAFHAVGERSVIEVPSPYTITMNARRTMPESAPYDVMEKGLSPTQMASAISDEGLTPVLSEFISKSYLKAIARAYLNVGLPVIIGMTLAWEDESGVEAKANNGCVIGEHAVTLMGYRLSDNLPAAFSADNVTLQEGASIPKLYMLSSSIDKFYAHDDQIGPFASMEDRDEYWQRLETRWNCYSELGEKVDASVNTLIIPCFNKIRLRFPVILDFISACNTLFNGYWASMQSYLVWDARLFSVKQLKENISTGSLYQHTDAIIKIKLLSEKLPRFLWVVDAFVKGDDKLSESKPLMTYVFDATDIERGNYLCCGLHHDYDAYAVCNMQIKASEKDGSLDKFLKRQDLNINILNYLVNSYKNEDTTKLWLPEGAPLSIS